jgi:HK97 family phage prohead protease
MSGTPLNRAFSEPLEIRGSIDQRIIGGIVVPFGREALVSDGGKPYREMFQRGCCAKTIAERGDRVKLLAQHNMRQNPLGKAVELREDAIGLYGEFRVSATRDGDDVLELVRDGALDSFSIGFAPVKHEQRNGVTVRTEVRIREASVVTAPAYEDARITTLREQFAGLPIEEALSEIGDMIAGRALDPALVEPLLAALHAATTSATTPDGEPERSTEEPASATPGVPLTHSHLRALARRKDIL